MVRLRHFLLFALCFSPLAFDTVMAGKSYYDILGVSKSSSEDQLKRAYRKLALKYHPDKNPGDEDANKKFAEINNVYEILSDEKKRKIYDQHGEEGLKQHEQGGGGGHQGNDIFSQFFGRGGFGGFGFGGQEEEEQALKGETLVVKLAVTLKDLYVGRSLKVARDKNVIKPAKGTRKCNCKTKMVTKQVGPGMYQQFQQQECETCPNVKYEREETFLTVEVEPGMQDGHEISFFEEGEPIIDGDPGDLKFKISTAPHSMFRRDGNHLHYDMTISLVDALVGFDTTIDHLDGHKVTVSSTSVTTPGMVKKIVGQGMPIYDRAKKYGDMWIHFTVAFPSSLTDKQKKAIKDNFA